MKGLLILGCINLFILSAVNIICLYKMKQKQKNKFYHTPRLSSLKGKKFSEYIDYLTRDL